MSSGRKILFIGSFPKKVKGGTSTATSSLLNSAVFKGENITTIDSTLKSIRHNYMLGRMWRALKRFIRLHSMLSNNRPDVALIFFGHGWGFIEKGFYTIYLRLWGIRSVIAPRSGILLNNLKHRFYEFWLRRVFKRASFILCQGNYWQTIYSNYVAKDKLKVVFNWIRLPDEKVDCEATRPGPVKLLFMGWYEAYKGVGTILKVARELAQQGEKFELHMYGEGSLRKDMESFVLEHGLEKTVFIHGWINGEEKKEAFLSSNVLLQASTVEGMPNVILEAMSYGLPVIANGISSIPEVVQHKTTGILYFRQDQKDLAQQIKSLIHNPSLCKYISKNARKWIEDEHQVEEAAQHIMSLLYQI